MQVKKLELAMEQQTGAKLGKEYVKAIYCLTRWLFSAKTKIKIPDLQNIR